LRNSRFSQSELATSSFLNTTYTCPGVQWRNKRLFVNCIVPSGQVLIEIQRDIGSTQWDVLRTVTATEQFHIACPDVEVDIRLTSSGGATFVLPQV